jgi:hypothetical protein
MAIDEKERLRRWRLVLGGEAEGIKGGTENGEGEGIGISLSGDDLGMVSTRMIVFDTAVVDLTDDLQDPVDLLFGTQLGGALISTAPWRTASRPSPVLRRPSWYSLLIYTKVGTCKRFCTGQRNL